MMVTRAMEDAGMAVRVDHGRLRLPAQDCRRIYEAMDGAREIRDWPGTYGVKKQKFVAFWLFTGWTQFSLGLNVSLEGPNVELHLPFGFFKIGFRAPVCRYRGRFSKPEAGT